MADSEGRPPEAGPDLRDRLSAAEAVRILAWLGVPPVSASRAWLDELLAAYARHVPWESASRIVRRASVACPDEAVAWPRAFWTAAMDRGLGGTCFESNAALAALLAAVGIPCVLTINDMPPQVACHTALVVEVDGDRCVVDVGFPLYAAVPLPRAGESTEALSAWGTFSARPASSGPPRFLIGQHPHPKPLAFELVDRGVSRGVYAAAMRADYGPEGLFLDRVVVKKIVDGDVWRFASSEHPWRLECFRGGVRETRPLPGDIEAAASVAARHFSMDGPTVSRALALVHA